MKPALVLLLGLLATSCHGASPPSPRYVLGPPYQGGGVWYYPSESYDARETGLAMVYRSRHSDLTADGEVFDQSALTGAHQTLQLPAVVQLTNLENGSQVVVRINDRGPATPHRLVEVTRRVAALLRFANDDAARVRLEVLAQESHAAADALPGVPKLDIAAAPVGAVQQTPLPPPGGTATGAPGHALEPEQQAASPAPTIAVLPETVLQRAPDPGQLFIQLGTFQTYQYAAMQRALVARLGAHIVSARQERQQTHRVMIGPLATVELADMTLDQVLRAGVTDARIVVE